MDWTFRISNSESADGKREFLVLQKIFRDRRLVDHVKFPGFVPQSLLPACYSMADVYVQASLRESFCSTICKAMVCGRPTVAIRTGAAPEIIKDGVNGLLIEVSDEEAIAQAVIKIISNEELAKSLGRNARKTIEEKYSWESVAKVLYDILFKKNRVICYSGSENTPNGSVEHPYPHLSANEIVLLSRY